MYQYYNYLIFEKNKDSFNDINPDLRKMTYKYDSEVKNAYMTVQASPEVIKAAMGMTVTQETEAEKEMMAAGSKHGQIKEKREDRVKKYSKEAIMNVFKQNEKYLVSPLEEPERFGISQESQGILKLLLNDEPCF